MRRERIIRPTVRVQICRHDKTRQRRIRHQRTNAGCGVNVLSGLRQTYLTISFSINWIRIWITLM
ncbi:hypothetical protein CF57_23530 [Escherichia coli]|nr:hypothetical protein BU34_07110 [Escherichia coli]AHM35883.1 hypothetical protein CF57_23530 [Escherichia coli]